VTKERDELVELLIDAYHGAKDAGATTVAALAASMADRLLASESFNVKPSESRPTVSETFACHPRGHRYERVGLTDRLRCRRCGYERPG
jgi:hypothetical protein